MERQANLNEPKSIDEARSRLVEVEAQLIIINDSLAARFRYRDSDGMPMDPEEHLEWRKRATASRNWYIREQTILTTWIEAYERDLRAEEEAERDRAKIQARLREQELQTERRRLKREATRESARVYAIEQEETRRWKEEMIQKHGTAKPPAHVFRQQEIELEKLRSERRQQVLAMQENSERLMRRKQAHKEWLKALEIEDPVDGLDPENLLRHAYRALRRVARNGQGILTEEERSLVDVISQRYLILADLAGDQGA